jgi:hypothetical protein
MDVKDINELQHEQVEYAVQQPLPQHPEKKTISDLARATRRRNAMIARTALARQREEGTTYRRNNEEIREDAREQEEDPEYYPARVREPAYQQEYYTGPEPSQSSSLWSLHDLLRGADWGSLCWCLLLLYLAREAPRACGRAGKAAAIVACVACVFAGLWFILVFAAAFRYVFLS